MLRSTASLVAAASGGPRLLPGPGPAPPARSTPSSLHMWQMDSFENLDWKSRRGCPSTSATSPSARRHASMSSRVVNVRNSFRAFILSRP